MTWPCWKIFWYYFKMWNLHFDSCCVEGFCFTDDFTSCYKIVKIFLIIRFISLKIRVSPSQRFLKTFFTIFFFSSPFCWILFIIGFKRNHDIVFNVQQNGEKESYRYLALMTWFKRKSQVALFRFNAEILHISLKHNKIFKSTVRIASPVQWRDVKEKKGLFPSSRVRATMHAWSSRGNGPTGEVKWKIVFSSTGSNSAEALLHARR